MYFDSNILTTYRKLVDQIQWCFCALQTMCVDPKHWIILVFLSIHIYFKPILIRHKTVKCQMNSKFRIGYKIFGYIGSDFDHFGQIFHIVDIVNLNTLLNFDNSRTITWRVWRREVLKCLLFLWFKFSAFLSICGRLGSVVRPQSTEQNNRACISLIGTKVLKINMFFGNPLLMEPIGWISPIKARVLRGASAGGNINL